MVKTGQNWVYFILNLMQKLGVETLKNNAQKTPKILILGRLSV
jgi:hypothetical protein